MPGEGRGWRIPRFQFQRRGQLVRNIDKVGPHIRADARPLAARTRYPGVLGLYVASSMHANRPCVAAYERARAAIPSAPVLHRALADPALLPRLSEAAQRLGYRLV